MKNLKKIFLILLILGFICAPVLAQEEEDQEDNIAYRSWYTIKLMINSECPDQMIEKKAPSQKKGGFEKFIDTMRFALLTDDESVGESREISSVEDKITYQFYLDRLSKNLRLRPVSIRRGEQKHSIIFRYKIVSQFKNITLENIRISPKYAQLKGNLEGKILETKIDSAKLAPGENTSFEITLLYPQNWSLKKKPSEGLLEFQITADMKLPLYRKDIETSSLTPKQAGLLEKSPESITCTLPMEPITRYETVSMVLPVEKLFYLLIGLGFISLIVFPSSLIYRTMVPVSLTVKYGDKLKSFRMTNKDKIPIYSDGSLSKSEGAQILAEIERRYRRFVIVEKSEGVIPDFYKSKKGTMPIELGKSFSLNIQDKIVNFQFLPGNLEEIINHQMTQAKIDEIADEDLEEGPGNFRL